MELMQLHVHRVLIQEKGKFLLHFVADSTPIQVYCSVEEKEERLEIYFEAADKQDNQLINFLNSSHEWHLAMQALYGISKQPYAIANDNPHRTPPWAKDPIQLQKIEVTGGVTYTLQFTEQDGQEKQAFFEFTTLDDGDLHLPSYSITSGDKTVSYRINPREIARAMKDFHNAFHEEKLEW